jgi:hypothetical protein
MQTTSNVLVTALIALGVASVPLTGCDDPANGKPRATTVEPTATSQPPTAALQTTVKYTFDQTASKVEWTGSKVTGKHDGSFGIFKGTIDLVDGAPEKSKVDISIDADSVTTDIERLANGSRAIPRERFSPSSTSPSRASARAARRQTVSTSFRHVFVSASQTPHQCNGDPHEPSTQHVPHRPPPRPLRRLRRCAPAFPSATLATAFTDRTYVRNVIRGHGRSAIRGRERRRQDAGELPT